MWRLTQHLEGITGRIKKRFTWGGGGEKRGGGAQRGDIVETRMSSGVLAVSHLSRHNPSPGSTGVTAMTKGRVGVGGSRAIVCSLHNQRPSCGCSSWTMPPPSSVKHRNHDQTAPPGNLQVIGWSLETSGVFGSSCCLWYDLQGPEGTLRGPEGALKIKRRRFSAPETYDLRRGRPDAELAADAALLMLKSKSLGISLWSRAYSFLLSRLKSDAETKQAFREEEGANCVLLLLLYIILLL